MSPSRPGHPLLPLFGLGLVAALGVAGCAAISPPPGASAQGKAVADLYAIILVPAIAIFILVEGILTIAILRYRRRDDELPPQVHGHRGLELLWTVIPALIVLAVFGLSMQTLGHVDAKSAKPAVTVDVAGRQWFWDFTYEQEGIAISGAGTEPEIVLPVGQTIRFVLTSDNVIHSFYIPRFLFKRDDIPGVKNQFDLTIQDPGTYGGQCAEFCGLGHATMRFRIRAVSPDEYAAWVEQQRAASPSPGSSGGSATSGDASGGSTSTNP